MHHLLVVALIAVGFSAYIDAKSDEEACISMIESIQNMCCETMDVMKHEDDHKCKHDAKNWKCEDSKCILEKRGLLKGEEVDEDKFSEMIADWESKDSDMAPIGKRIKDHCLGDKYKKLEVALEDVCYATQFHICVGLHSMMECQKWKDSDECKGVPDDKEQCKSMTEKQ